MLSTRRQNVTRAEKKTIIKATFSRPAATLIFPHQVTFQGRNCAPSLQQTEATSRDYFVRPSVLPIELDLSLLGGRGGVVVVVVVSSILIKSLLNRREGEYVFREPLSD